MPAWITPPTFSYPYPASVDDLEIIRNNLLYLHSELYSSVHSILENEVECDDPFSGAQIANILWIEHREDSLYYRIRAKSEAASHDVQLYIKFYDVDGDLKGTHQENQTIGTSYSVFNNSGSAVDISGWGLTVNALYKVEVSLAATTDSGDDCWVETNYIYEEA